MQHARNDLGCSGAFKIDSSRRKGYDYGIKPKARAVNVLAALRATLFSTTTSRERIGWSIPPGHRVYAIGDIHGRADLYDRIAEVIYADASLCDCKTISTVFLGDYIDRGPDSAGVLSRLSSKAFPTDFVALRGNHEAVFLEFLDDPKVLEKWRFFGGLETLVSYDVDVSDVVHGRGFRSAQERLLRNLPAVQLSFLKETIYSYSLGDYFFCHAGVRPGVALEEQHASDLLWIRNEFLDCSHSMTKRVVHGHSPVETVELLPNRINVDTGAYATNVLTAVVLEGNEIRVLDTRPQRGAI